MHRMRRSAQERRIAQPVSLLWPDGRATAAIGRLADEAIADLHLAEIVSAIVGTDAPAGRLAARERFAERVLTELLTGDISEIKLLQEHVHDALGGIVYDRTHRRPMILPVLVEV